MLRIVDLPGVPADYVTSRSGVAGNKVRLYTRYVRRRSVRIVCAAQTARAFHRVVARGRFTGCNLLLLHRRFHFLAVGTGQGETEIDRGTDFERLISEKGSRTLVIERGAFSSSTVTPRKLVRITARMCRL